MRAEHKLSPVHLFHSGGGVPIRAAIVGAARAGLDSGAGVVISLSGACCSLERGVVVVGVRVLIKVDSRVRREADRVGARGDRVVELVRIEDLHSKRLPAASRPPHKSTSPTLPNPAVLALDGRE